ncbi:hypothetical protein JL721_3531 [Aureococcus anophagefferens]|nr:hypothetical protein JL721_3531 [Aureococcus anophagefferens]
MFLEDVRPDPSLASDSAVETAASLASTEARALHVRVVFFPAYGLRVGEKKRVVAAFPDCLLLEDDVVVPLADEASRWEYCSEAASLGHLSDFSPEPSAHRRSREERAKTYLRHRARQAVAGREIRAIADGAMATHAEAYDAARELKREEDRLVWWIRVLDSAAYDGLRRGDLRMVVAIEGPTLVLNDETRVGVDDEDRHWEPCDDRRRLRPPPSEPEDLFAKSGGSGGSVGSQTLNTLPTLFEDASFEDEARTLVTAPYDPFRSVELGALETASGASLRRVPADRVAAGSGGVGRGGAVGAPRAPRRASRSRRRSLARDDDVAWRPLDARSGDSDASAEDALWRITILPAGADAYGLDVGRVFLVVGLRGPTGLDASAATHRATGEFRPSASTAPVAGRELRVGVDGPYRRRASVGRAMAPGDDERLTAEEAVVLSAERLHAQRCRDGYFDGPRSIIRVPPAGQAAVAVVPAADAADAAKLKPGDVAEFVRLQLRRYNGLRCTVAEVYGGRALVTIAGDAEQGGGDAIDVSLRNLRRIGPDRGARPSPSDWRPLAPIRGWKKAKAEPAAPAPAPAAPAAETPPVSEQVSESTGPTYVYYPLEWQFRSIGDSLETPSEDDLRSGDLMRQSLDSRSLEEPLFAAGSARSAFRFLRRLAELATRGDDIWAGALRLEGLDDASFATPEAMTPEPSITPEPSVTPEPSITPEPSSSEPTVLGSERAVRASTRRRRSSAGPGRAPRPSRASTRRRRSSAARGRRTRRCSGRTTGASRSRAVYGRDPGDVFVVLGDRGKRWLCDDRLFVKKADEDYSWRWCEPTRRKGYAPPEPSTDEDDLDVRPKSVNTDTTEEEAPLFDGGSLSSEVTAVKATLSVEESLEASTPSTSAESAASERRRALVYLGRQARRAAAGAKLQITGDGSVVSEAFSAPTHLSGDSAYESVEDAAGEARAANFRHQGSGGAALPAQADGHGRAGSQANKLAIARQRELASGFGGDVARSEAKGLKELKTRSAREVAALDARGSAECNHTTDRKRDDYVAAAVVRGPAVDHGGFRAKLAVPVQQWDLRYRGGKVTTLGADDGVDEDPSVPLTDPSFETNVDWESTVEWSTEPSAARSDRAFAAEQLRVDADHAFAATQLRIRPSGGDRRPGHGRDVTEDDAPPSGPVGDMTVADLKTYARVKRVDLSGCDTRMAMVRACEPDLFGGEPLDAEPEPVAAEPSRSSASTPSHASALRALRQAEVRRVVAKQLRDLARNALATMEELWSAEAAAMARAVADRERDIEARSRPAAARGAGGRRGGGEERR